MLISCHYNNNEHYTQLANAAKENEFDIYNLFDVVDNSLGYRESESDIFNELFLREWF